ncbi:MAG: transposase [Actinomycetota bacterium]
MRATWAPKGHTPVLRHHFNWKRLSVSGALAYRSDRSAAALVFQVRPGTYNDEVLIDFLAELHAHLDLAKVSLIWDGLPSYRSRRMKAWIASQRDWLVVERLPGYAPDLNPVELVWANLKGRELANLCPDTIEEAEQAAQNGLGRIGTDAEMCFAFLRHCGLSL